MKDLKDEYYIWSKKELFKVSGVKHRVDRNARWLAGRVPMDNRTKRRLAMLLYGWPCQRTIGRDFFMVGRDCFIVGPSYAASLLGHVERAVYYFKSYTILGQLGDPLELIRFAYKPLTYTLIYISEKYNK